MLSPNYFWLCTVGKMEESGCPLGTMSKVDPRDLGSPGLDHCGDGIATPTEYCPEWLHPLPTLKLHYCLKNIFSGGLLPRGVLFFPPLTKLLSMIRLLLRIAFHPPPLLNPPGNNGKVSMAYCLTLA